MKRILTLRNKMQKSSVTYRRVRENFLTGAAEIGARLMVVNENFKNIVNVPCLPIYCKCSNEKKTFGNLQGISRRPRWIFRAYKVVDSSIANINLWESHEITRKLCEILFTDERRAFKWIRKFCHAKIFFWPNL